MTRTALALIAMAAVAVAGARFPETTAGQALPRLSPDSPFVSSAVPPDRFWYGPGQMTVVRVAFVPRAAVDPTCQSFSSTKPPEGYVIRGCTVRAGGGPPLMIVANPCETPVTVDERTQCHELAHVNGWAGDHPQ